MGFELFQKTVWRSAAARLQHRPKSGAQRNSIAQSLAGPGEDEGLLGVGFPRAVSAAQAAPRTALAPPPGDFAFGASAARPAPGPAPRTAQPGARRPLRLGAGRERRGEEGEEEPDASVCGDRGALHRELACPSVCARPYGPVRGAGSAAPGSGACGTREPAARADLRTLGAGSCRAAPRAACAGCKVLYPAHTFPQPRTRAPAPAFPPSSHPPFPDSALRCPSPHTRLFVFVEIVNVVFVRKIVSSSRCRE